MVKRRKRTHSTIFRYLKLWNEPDTYLFNGWVDATIGIIVLVIIPIYSLAQVVLNNSIVWVSYGFPLISVSFAALYDCYGRYVSAQGDEKYAAVKRSKIAIRAMLHVLGLTTACIICGYEELMFLRCVPFVLLALAGCILCREWWWRVKYSFLFAFGK